jgi:hypothetical protein
MGKLIRFPNIQLRAELEYLLALSELPDTTDIRAEVLEDLLPLAEVLQQAVNGIEIPLDLPTSLPEHLADEVVRTVERVASEAAARTLSQCLVVAINLQAEICRLRRPGV